MFPGISTSVLQRPQLGLTCKENALEAPTTRQRARKAGTQIQPQLPPAHLLPPPPAALAFGDSRAASNTGDVPMEVQHAEPTPLPKLSWANSGVLWRQMRVKDRTSVAPDTDLRLRHPGIAPNMRTILLDWMMEVGRRERAGMGRGVGVGRWRYVAGGV